MASGTVLRLGSALTLLRSRGIGIAFLAVGLALLAVSHSHARVLAPSAAPKKLIFPVVGASHFTNDFGAARSQGSHQGNDVLAPWRSPVVAVESGTVQLWTASARAGCMLWLDGDSGTRYAYVHLNNDLTDQNDNKGGCVPGIAWAPTMVEGQRVVAGELLGYNGDSGDADGGSPHLHFELQVERGYSVSPYKWLRRAKPLIYPVINDVGPQGVGFRLEGTVVRTQESDQGTYLVVAATFLSGTDGSRYDIDRTVFATIVSETTVLTKKGRKRAVASIGMAKQNDSVTVWTAPVQPTVDTALGRLGALTATKVLVTPG